MQDLLDFGLPTEPEPLHWTKERLENEIFSNQELKGYVQIDHSYTMNFWTYLVYDFSNSPLRGKYQSVAIDKRRGIVLSGKTTSSIAERTLSALSYSGLDLQRLLAKEIGQSSLHSMSFGFSVYYSLAGVSARNSDWVALHQMTEVNKANGTVEFISLDRNHRFNLGKKPSNFSQSLTNALTHNKVLREAMLQNARMRGDFRPVKKTESLIYQDDLAINKTLTSNTLLVDLQKVAHKNSHFRYGMRIAEEFELLMTIKDQVQLYYHIRRHNAFF